MSLGPITLGHYLSLGAILFALSVIGIFLNRKNLIVLLMAIELMLLAVNLNFVAFSHYLGDMAGQVFVFFILTVAAAESAIGLAILVVLFRNRVDDQRRRARRAEGLSSDMANPTLANLARSRVALAPLAGAVIAGLFGKAGRPPRRAHRHHPRRRSSPSSSRRIVLKQVARRRRALQRHRLRMDGASAA